MSFVDKYLFDTHSDKKEVVKPAPSTTPKSFINPAHVPTTDYSVTHSTESYSDQSLIDAAKSKLLDAINNNKPSGVGYTNFMSSKDELAELPDEGKRYTLAFKTLSSVGLTKSVLLSTANATIDTINTEVNKFNAAYNAAHKSKVDDKRSTVAQKQQLLEQLTSDIARLTAEADRDDSGMSSQYNSFSQAADQLKGSVQSDIDKINQYIN